GCFPSLSGTGHQRLPRSGDKNNAVCRKRAGRTKEDPQELVPDKERKPSERRLHAGVTRHPEQRHDGDRQQDSRESQQPLVTRWPPGHVGVVLELIHTTSTQTLNDLASRFRGGLLVPRIARPGSCSLAGAIRSTKGGKGIRSRGAWRLVGRPERRGTGRATSRFRWYLRDFAEQLAAVDHLGRGRTVARDRYPGLFVVRAVVVGSAGRVAHVLTWLHRHFFGVIPFLRFPGVPRPFQDDDVPLVWMVVRPAHHAGRKLVDREVEPRLRGIAF